MDIDSWLWALKDLEITTISKYAGYIILAGGLWHYAVRPFYKFVRSVQNTTQGFATALPTLIKIADEFRPNGGNSLRDIVDRIENGIAFSNQRHRAICSYFDVALFETDPRGFYTFVSKDWCLMTGLSPEQAVGDGWINGVVAEQRDAVMAAWKRAVEEKREFALEFPIYCPGTRGKTVRISSRAFPSRRGTGVHEKMIGIVGIIRIVDEAIDADVTNGHHAN